MTTDSHNRISPLAIGIAAIAPRYWARWFAVVLALLIAFFVSLDSGADGNISPDGTVHVSMTPWSWAIGAVLVVYTVAVFIRNVRLTRYYAEHGTPRSQASAVQRLTGNYVEDNVVEAQPVPAEAPVSAATALEVPTVIGGRKARHIEDHGSFDVVDRRRWSA